METSEDDAGASANASRRVSAREKDVGRIEDVNATNIVHQEPSEMQASCETNAMSEDNFDGDSVPSPSTQDVNTSTEAILDMIDEIVDGPGAPKRLSESPEVRSDSKIGLEISSVTDIPPKSDEVVPVCSSSVSGTSTSQSELTKVLSHSQATSSELDRNLSTETRVNTESIQSCSKEISVSSVLDSPSSSEVILNASDKECGPSDRTIQSVVLCDKNDKVNLESAVSTSSDNNHDSRDSSVSVSTRSPLRRRLVRPVPSRPDSTVTSSSSVDSSVNSEISQSECTVKDVSSSSDIVTSVNDSKPEEIRNISEVSPCRAETSMGSPKKIRLIRQKVPQICNVDSEDGKKESDLTECHSLSSNSQCQGSQPVDPLSSSLSSENINPCLDRASKESSVESTNTVPKSLEVKTQENTHQSIEASKESHNEPSTKEKIEEECKKVPPIKLNLPVKDYSVNVSSNENEASTFSQESDIQRQVPKLTIKFGSKSSDEDIKLPVPKLTIKTIRPELELKNEYVSEQISLEKSKLSIPKLTIKTQRTSESESKSEKVSEQISSENKEEIKSPIPKLTIKTLTPLESESKIVNKSEQICEADDNDETKLPIPNLIIKTLRSTENENICDEMPSIAKSEEMKSPIPKLTIKTPKHPDLESKNEIVSEQLSSLENSEEVKSPIPKLTIKTLRPTESEGKTEIVSEVILSDKKTEEIKSPIPKLTIKTLRPPDSDAKNENVNELCLVEKSVEMKSPIPKLTIKTLRPPESESKNEKKQPEKINELHRKSSSSEISESECSENDESSNTSDQTSTSDHGPSDIVPKVTIKLGKPGTNAEGQFYTEKNSSKSTVKTILASECEAPLSPSKLQVFISQSEETQTDKIPKLTIKTVACKKSGNQPLSPKLTIKPIRPPDYRQENISSQDTATNALSGDKDNLHVPKITIKAISKPEGDVSSKSKKSHHIIPLSKSTDSIDVEENIDNKVPVVFKSNIKSNVKPKDSVESNKDDIPKIPKLNIKLLKNPASNLCDDTICDDLKLNKQESGIPIVKKINIKPIIKPIEMDTLKETKSEAQETDNSSDENGDNIVESTSTLIDNDNDNRDDNVNILNKLKLKLHIKPEEVSSPSSPKSPNVTKLIIKPLIKPDETREKVTNDEPSESHVKNPPLLLKINMKTAETYVGDQINLNKNDHSHCNNIDNDSQTKSTPVSRQNTDSILEVANKEIAFEKDLSKLNCLSPNDSTLTAHEIKNEINFENSVCQSLNVEVKQNCHPQLDPHDDQRIEKDNIQEDIRSTENKQTKTSTLNRGLLLQTNTETREFERKGEPTYVNTSNINDCMSESIVKAKVKNPLNKQNCTLLKKLLESNTENLNEDKNIAKISTHSYQEERVIPKHFNSIDEKVNLCNQSNTELNHDDTDHDKNNISCNSITSKTTLLQDKNRTISENLTKPLEISVSEKLVHSPDQDSPRIILKINKHDLSASSKTYNEDTKDYNSLENPDSHLNERHQGKNLTNSRKKAHVDTPMPVGKRLRSSRLVNSVEKEQMSQQILNKRPSTDKSPPQKDLKLLDTKRMKLGHLLSTKTITPIPSIASSLSPPTKSIEEKQDVKIVNHTLLNNENCAKNGSSKLHNILTNLQNKQLHALPFNDLTHRENNESPDLKSSTSTGSIEVEIERTSPIRPKMHEMIFQESSESREYNTASEEILKDPLEVESSMKDNPSFVLENLDIPKPVEMTPQPKKRGRPRKIPLSEGAKIVLPVTALEERPQRSLRLSRERPPLVVKPRGRGRGRGRKLMTEPKEPTYSDDKTFQPVIPIEPKPEEEIDPTSSRIKLPRMTEALDKMPFSTPLSSRRRNSSSSDLFEDSQDFKSDMDTSLPKMENPFLKSPEIFGSGRGMRGRGSRGGRGRPSRTPRGLGRGRGGGRGAMYMKETMGIYGRVCGPATTTVQLFEEETCMMDDNATPSKPSHLLDEDSQSSVKSSTNESSKMKKSKFADLFDSNKIWTADDVKEYTWPPEDSGNDEQQVMMIQEQVAMFLGVKSFKRRYPELKRRTITGDERNYVLQKGLVTEALCDLGITAVDASEVLDIMLSDYPHKYEEYRSHQRIKQINEPEPIIELKCEVKVEKLEVKLEQKPADSKPEPPKVDPEKLRLEMAAAAVASASEWNSRMNALRRGACADLQSLTVLRRRAPPPAPTVRVRPPAGFYPHALLPGQYQHTYRRYTPQELRYFPLNTVVAAPPAPPSPAESSSDSEQDWGSQYSTSDDSDTDTHRNAKRKKLTKTKRNSQSEVKEEEVDTCRTCKLRLEANRKYTHERFLVCATCNCKLHPGCVDLQPDTIRKAREYPWQCAECKTCGSCARAASGAALHCDLCDRAYHTTCLGLQTAPSGRWHCVDCSVCKSCGARSPAGLGADDCSTAGTSTPGANTSTPSAGTSTPAGANDEPRWHHQTRRGPGGHKVYSHSLCTPCARAYRIGRYCPLCERSFIGPKGTMQLVICKLCDRQLHQECVRQTVSQLKVLDYTCGECRRGGITSRAAAVRLAPRTIATLFMAKRRFNKYAHRQYLQSRQQQADMQDDDDDPH